MSECSEAAPRRAMASIMVSAGGRGEAVRDWFLLRGGGCRLTSYAAHAKPGAQNDRAALEVCDGVVGAGVELGGAAGDGRRFGAGAGLCGRGVFLEASSFAAGVADGDWERRCEGSCCR